MRHGHAGPLEPCLPECVIDCVCPGQGEPCEHPHYSFFDDGEQYCVACFTVLNDDEEAA